MINSIKFQNRWVFVSNKISKFKLCQSLELKIRRKENHLVFSQNFKCFQARIAKKVPLWKKDRAKSIMNYLLKKHKNN